MDEDKMKMLLELASNGGNLEDILGKDSKGSKEQLGEHGEDGEDGKEEFEEDSPEAILEEYKLWRKNCKLMYSFITETALMWPSLSIQMFNQGSLVNKNKDTKLSNYRNLLIGTYSSDESPEGEFIKICTLQIPVNIINKEIKLSDEEIESIDSRLKISKKYEIGDFEANKVRLNFSDNKIFSSINSNGDIEVFQIDSKMNLVSRCKSVGDGSNGFGLCWDPNKANRLISGSEDKIVKIWEYTEVEGENEGEGEGEDRSKTIKDIRLVKSYEKLHSNIINDVRFSYKKKNVWGSVDEDGFFYLGDLEKDEIVIKANLKESSKTVMNSFTFSPFSENLVFFGGDNGNCYLYDLRQIDRVLHTFIGHKKSVTNVEWDPFHENVVGSSSLDRRVILWDINRIGQEQTVDESEDGVPELLMMHGGHTGGVNDFTFSRDTEWLVASCSDDNIVHVWQGSDEVVDPDSVVYELDEALL